MKVPVPHFRVVVQVIIFGIIACVYTGQKAQAQVFVGGELLTNTNFVKANNPYIVVQDLTVPTGITLTIEPGTELRFSSDTRLNVHGDLIAAGTQADSIHFTLNSQIPNQSLWNGIVFDSARTYFDAQGNYLSGTILSHVSVYNSNYSMIITGNSGILTEHCLLDKSSFGIYINDAENCVIRDCRIKRTGFGIFIPSALSVNNNVFENNIVENTFNIGILINNGQGRIHHNRFTGNKVLNNYIGIYVGNDGLLDIGHNSFSGNIVSGNSFEGVRIYQDSTVFSGNRVFGNGTGLHLRHSDHSQITENIITGSDNWAIEVSDSSTYNLIERNLLSGNGGAIRLRSDETSPSYGNTIIHNTICQNDGTSFGIEVASQEPISFNNIFRNGDLKSFINGTEELIHAENNWWGSNRESAIDSLILDQLDNNWRGLVKYKQYLQGPDTIAPIPAPRNVVKRQAGNDVIVSWDPVEVSDLAGYNVHFGDYDGMNFTQKLDAGDVTTFILPSFSVFDSIAVTAYDAGADGNDDQLQGHESEYAFALLSPYAGPDTTVCHQDPVRFNKATAFNYESITWTTAGDGTFNGSHSLNPLYFPGTNDYTAGQVELSMTVTGIGFQLTDQVMLFFSNPPTVFAGNDTTIFSDTSYLSLTARAENYDNVIWTSSGDGLFLYPDSLTTTYQPGPEDQAAGSCLLTLHASSGCGQVADVVELQLLKSITIQGRVYAGDQLAPGSSLVFFKADDTSVKQDRGSFTTADGNFTISHVNAGDYYIYVVPDQQLFPAYAPTYYFNKLHWKDAYRLQVVEDTYDVDVNLVRLAATLPEGEGRIKGYCVSSGPSGQCGSIAVLLYNKTGDYLLGWSWLKDDGSFEFPSLPFGDYLLAGEKAGYDRFFSVIVSLTPEIPEVMNAELKIEPYKISIQIPDPATQITHPIAVYPVPAGDRLFFSDLPFSGCYTVLITSVEGKLSTRQFTTSESDGGIIDVADLPPGLYLTRIFYNGSFLQASKILKQ